jgi:hypothetical protein
MAKRRFSSRLASDESTTRGYRVLTSAECTTIMIAELAVTSGLGWFWSGLYETYVILCACVAILMFKSNLMGSFSLHPQSSQ